MKNDIILIIVHKRTSLHYNLNIRTVHNLVSITHINNFDKNVGLIDSADNNYSARRQQTGIAHSIKITKLLHYLSVYHNLLYATKYLTTVIIVINICINGFDFEIGQ